jgi:hypothetical protein
MVRRGFAFVIARVIPAFSVASSELETVCGCEIDPCSRSR